jgi:hypothetical protein
MAQWFLAFSNQTLALFVGFFFCNVKRSGCFGKIRNEEVSKECNGQRNDSAYDEEPLDKSIFELVLSSWRTYLPTLFTHLSVQTLIYTSLQIAAEHTRKSCSAVKQGHSFAPLFFCIPTGNKVLWDDID